MDGQSSQLINKMNKCNELFIIQNKYVKICILIYVYIEKMHS